MTMRELDRTNAFVARMSTVQFHMSLAAEQALLASAAFAQASEAGLADASLKFEDDGRRDETRGTCSPPMAVFILAELRRIAAIPDSDTELSFALTEAGITVRRAIDSVHG